MAAWHAWGTGNDDVLPGRTMADLKIAGVDHILATLAGRARSSRADVTSRRRVRGAGGGIRLPAVRTRRAAGRPAGQIAVSHRSFFVVAIGLVLLSLALTRVIENEYYFFAGYVILQYIVLATA